MILSAQSIRRLCTRTKMLDPFVEEERTHIPSNCMRQLHHTDGLNISYGLSSASYSIRLAQDLFLACFVEKECFGIFSTLEKFTMPDDICGIVHDKSTWARLGMAVQNTFIDPGWTGYLTLEISNHSEYDLLIPKGTGIAQIVFHLLDEPTELPYKGKYQNQGVDPQKAL